MQCWSISKTAVRQWTTKAREEELDYVYSNRRLRNVRREVFDKNHLNNIDKCMEDNLELSSSELQAILLHRAGLKLSSIYIRKLRDKQAKTFGMGMGTTDMQDMP